MHLFYDIILSRPWATDELNGRYVPYDQAAACGRLCAVLKSSPHLTLCIHHIGIPFLMDVIAQICVTIEIYAPRDYKGNLEENAM
jgi:hypothetical protein